jgi:tRNA-2-methylthio-N6-dimethylallyladenosine synthase
MVTKKSLYIRTFGCQMNVQDSEKIRGIYRTSGFQDTNNAVNADVIVINTCSVRQKAEQKFYSELGRLKKLKKMNPHLRILVAGCIAELEGQKIQERFPYVDFVCGTRHIDKISQWIEGTYHESLAKGENETYHVINLPSARDEGVKVFISIMYGCNNFCSYCVVPYTRGKERSRPSQDIINEIKDLTKKGIKEVTLLGQNVNSYGKGLDEGINFTGLLRKIHTISGIERVRFVTSHPKDLTDELITSMAEMPEICEHIHLPLQAGSDRILALMNRKYLISHYMDRIHMLRRLIPDISITTDIIVGFPSETEEDFMMTLKVMREICYDGTYAFKYSQRPFTKALTMDNHVSEDVKGRRLTEVLKLQDQITYEKNLLLEGHVLEILVEGKSETDPTKLTGRTRTNKIVNFYGNDRLIGRLITVNIIEAKRHSLLGKVL